MARKIHFAVVWYPSGPFGTPVPHFMCDYENGNWDDEGPPSLFDSENEATEAAERTPAANIWPYVVVELP